MEDERQPEEEAPVLEPLTDDENPLVFTLTNRSIELITYLNSDKVAGFSAEQKDAFYYLVTLGDYIGPKKLLKYHRYRSNNRLRPNRFIYLLKIDE